MILHRLEIVENKRSKLVVSSLFPDEVFSFIKKNAPKSYKYYILDESNGTKKKILEEKSGKIKKCKYNHNEIISYIETQTDLFCTEFRNIEKIESDFYIKDYFPFSGFLILVAKTKEKANELYLEIKKMKKIKIDKIDKNRLEIHVSNINIFEFIK